MMFSENDILKWKELKERLNDESYSLCDVEGNSGSFYSEYYDNVDFSIYDDYIDLTNKYNYGLESDNVTQSMLDILDFLIEKRSQLEKWFGTKLDISILVKELDKALSDLDEKFNKNLTISDDQKVVENGENDDVKHEQSHEKSGDMVNHPEHYNTGSVECIDLMIELFGVEAVKGFCLCNSFKYLYRNMNKNGLEDIQKSVWYQNKYLELSKNNNKK